MSTCRFFFSKYLKDFFSQNTLNIKIYSLLVTLLKLVNLLKKRDFIISNYKINEFKLNMKKNIEMIYESSCFKMDTIFSLEFDRNKYYEDLKEKAQQEQTNNTND
jgi:hypothetical protein